MVKKGSAPTPFVYEWEGAEERWPLNEGGGNSLTLVLTQRKKDQGILGSNKYAFVIGKKGGRTRETDP